MRCALNSITRFAAVAAHDFIDFQEALLQTSVWTCNWQVVWGQGPDGTWSSKLIGQHYSARACHVLQMPTHVRMQARKERNKALATYKLQACENA